MCATATRPAEAPSSVLADAPVFSHSRHVTYFLRCFKTLLPHHYTSLDSSRLMLAFFTLAGLDLLGVLDQHIATDEDRELYIQSIYGLQHPDGGFRCFAGTMMEENLPKMEEISLGKKPQISAEAREWDVATIPGTYFALLSLVLLKDDLTRVDRERTLSWLKRTQAPDGGFGESVGKDGVIGGRDPRFAHTAMCVWWILAGESSGHVPRSSSGGDSDLDVQKMVDWMDQLQGYDGGISNTVGNESHAGFAYCAVTALSLLNQSEQPDEWKIRSKLDFDALTRWIVYRQTCLFAHPHSDSDSDSESDSESISNQTQHTPTPNQNDAPTSPEFFSLNPPLTVGFAGRPNKLADTCYAFWALGTLSAIGRLDTVLVAPLRRFLLVGTQSSQFGGFSKCVEDPLPDLYHSFLGLAAVAIIEERDEHGKGGIKALDPGLCVSREVVERVRTIRERWTKKV